MDQVYLDSQVKLREGKKWKNRRCIVKRLSPVADCVHLFVYKCSSSKLGRQKACVALQGYCGVETGYQIDSERQVLSLLCVDHVTVVAFPGNQQLIDWIQTLRELLGHEVIYPATLVSSPAQLGLRQGPVRLIITNQRVSLATHLPPTLLVSLLLVDLARYGATTPGEFCLHVGSRAGKCAGLYTLLTDFSKDIHQLLYRVSLSGSLNRSVHLTDCQSPSSISSVSSETSTGYSGYQCSTPTSPHNTPAFTFESHTTGSHPLRESSSCDDVLLDVTGSSGEASHARSRSVASTEANHVICHHAHSRSLPVTREQDIYMDLSHVLISKKSPQKTPSHSSASTGIDILGKLGISRTHRSNKVTCSSELLEQSKSPPPQQLPLTSSQQSATLSKSPDYVNDLFSVKSLPKVITSKSVINQTNQVIPSPKIQRSQNSQWVTLPRPHRSQNKPQSAEYSVTLPKTFSQRQNKHLIPRGRAYQTDEFNLSINALYSQYTDSYHNSRSLEPVIKCEDQSPVKQGSAVKPSILASLLQSVTSAEDQAVLKSAISSTSKSEDKLKSAISSTGKPEDKLNSAISSTGKPDHKLKSSISSTCKSEDQLKNAISSNGKPEDQLKNAIQSCDKTLNVAQSLLGSDKEHQVVVSEEPIYYNLPDAIILSHIDRPQSNSAPSIYNVERLVIEDSVTAVCKSSPHIAMKENFDPLSPLQAVDYSRYDGTSEGYDNIPQQSGYDNLNDLPPLIPSKRERRKNYNNFIQTKHVINGSDCNSVDSCAMKRSYENLPPPTEKRVEYPLSTSVPPPLPPKNAGSVPTAHSSIGASVLPYGGRFAMHGNLRRKQQKPTVRTEPVHSDIAGAYVLLKGGENTELVPVTHSSSQPMRSQNSTLRIVSADRKVMSCDMPLVEYHTDSDPLRENLANSITERQLSQAAAPVYGRVGPPQPLPPARGEMSFSMVPPPPTALHGGVRYVVHPGQQNSAFTPLRRHGRSGSAGDVLDGRSAHGGDVLGDSTVRPLPADEYIDMSQPRTGETECQYIDMSSTRPPPPPLRDSPPLQPPPPPPNDRPALRHSRSADTELDTDSTYILSHDQSQDQQIYNRSHSLPGTETYLPMSAINKYAQIRSTDATDSAPLTPPFQGLLEYPLTGAATQSVEIEPPEEDTASTASSGSTSSARRSSKGLLARLMRRNSSARDIPKVNTRSHLRGEKFEDRSPPDSANKEPIYAQIPAHRSDPIRVCLEHGNLTDEQKHRCTSLLAGKPHIERSMTPPTPPPNIPLPPVPLPSDRKTPPVSLKAGVVRTGRGEPEYADIDDQTLVDTSERRGTLPRRFLSLREPARNHQKSYHTTVPLSRRNRLLVTDDLDSSSSECATPASPLDSPLTRESVFTFDQHSVTALANQGPRGGGSETDSPRSPAMMSDRSVYMNLTYPSVVPRSKPKTASLNIRPPPPSDYANTGAPQLNYAEIDLSHHTPPKDPVPGRHSTIDYAMIDMVATAAAKKAGREHQREREATRPMRHQPLISDAPGQASPVTGKKLGRSNSAMARVQAGSVDTRKQSLPT